MEHYREYQCGACDYYFSHPIDRCPICADQFFWLVLTNRDVADSERRHFVAKMIALGGEGVSEAFLTYRERLWLPYNFWEKDPGGEMLLLWPFAKEVKLYQHKKKAGSEDANNTTARGSVFETNPALPINDFLQTLDHRAEGGNPSTGWVQPTHHQPVSAPAPTTHAQSPQAPAQKVANVSVTDETALVGLSIRDWLPPILIFVFFLLMSLSFLVLRYYKNDRHPIVSTKVEAVYDRSVLS